MTDKIFIRGLSLHAHHGVLPYEGKVGQSFTIDLVLEIDLSTAARTDKVADTVSYDQVVAVASSIFSGIRTLDDVKRCGEAGIDAVLIGETLMRDPRLARDFSGQPRADR
jgi:dihydroneopterin aldolase